MRKSRVLIVIDDVKLASASAFALEDSGLYEIQIEHDPACAVRVAREFQPRVILLDLDTFKDAASLIARDAAVDPVLRHVPILFLTTFVNGVAMDAPVSLSGGIRFLAKPVDPICLLQSVANFAAIAA